MSMFKLESLLRMRRNTCHAWYKVCWPEKVALCLVYCIGPVLSIWMASNSWLPTLNTVVVDGLLHIVGKVCGCFNSCTSICVRLLHTCKHSQASTAGHPGMTNCMYNATMHLPRGSYTADPCWLCVHTSTKQPCPLPVCLGKVSEMWHNILIFMPIYRLHSTVHKIC